MDLLGYDFATVISTLYYEYYLDALCSGMGVAA